MAGDLFESDTGSEPAEEPGLDAPLAERMRPRTLDELEGQSGILGEGCLLRDLIEKDRLSSLILWGPPGSGKTTLARVVARRTGAHFVPFSAVTAGVADVRRIIKEAKHRRRLSGVRTILFVDEIHRFNKAQQDAFLPHVEAGVVTLIGATTENPSFHVNSALLSRCRTDVLRALDEDALGRILDRALADEERGLGPRRVTVDEKARAFLLATANGDARSLLNALEAAVAGRPGPEVTIDLETAAQAVQRKAIQYDRAGDQHYDVISAFIKSMRASDVQASLYWLARMIEGGEDPLFVARRMVIFASEDIGLADPRALSVAMAVKEAVHFVGLPEGTLALTEGVVFLASAPKSRQIVGAWSAAAQDVRDLPDEPVPLHIRNAPTGLMKELGYGEGYGKIQQYLPGKLTGRVYYRPGTTGFEPQVGRRMEDAERARRAAEESS
jgi:putative ATPase